MKIVARVFTIILLLALAEKLPAQDAKTAATNAIAPLKISAAEATNYYDKEMTVTGKVAQVTVRSAVTFLNLDKPYPKSPFAVVIIHKYSKFYGNANALKGKTIEIKGKIKEYNGKPEMMLDNTNQLTVIGVTNLELLLKPKNLPAIAPTTNTPTNTEVVTNLSEIM